MQRRYLVVLLLLAGCSGGATVSVPPTELSQARAVWTAKGLRSYRFTVQKMAFTAPEFNQPVTITVRDGVAVDSPNHLKPYDTVEKLFSTIQQAYDAKAANLTTEFNLDGSPRSIVVDPVAILADDEYSLTITNLAPL